MQIYRAAGGGHTMEDGTTAGATPGGAGARRYARKLYPLFCGFEICDIGVSLRGRSGFFFAAPIGAFLVETETGYVLVDSGANEEIIWDPDRCPVYYNSFRHPV